MRLGVLVAKGAGGGRAKAAAEKLFSALKGHTVYTVCGFGGEMGGRALKARGAEGYLPSLRAAVDALFDRSPELYVLLGGDGLSSYVADRLIENGALRPTLLGVQGGTANVGPIVALSVEELAETPLEALTFSPCDALLAEDQTGALALGFNDLVLGDTLLATVEGRTRTISAAALLANGERIIMPPSRSVAQSLCVSKNGMPVGNGIKAPAQIVLSLINGQAVYGRAVQGALCCAAGEAHAAAMTLLSSPLITTESMTEGYADFFDVSQLLFFGGDKISVAGLAPSACLIADGNPYRLSGKLIVSIKQDAINILSRRNGR